MSTGTCREAIFIFFPKNVKNERFEHICTFTNAYDSPEKKIFISSLKSQVSLTTNNSCTSKLEVFFFTNIKSKYPWYIGNAFGSRFNFSVQWNSYFSTQNIYVCDGFIVRRLSRLMLYNWHISLWLSHFQTHDRLFQSANDFSTIVKTA